MSYRINLAILSLSFCWACGPAGSSEVSPDTMTAASRLRVSISGTRPESGPQALSEATVVIDEVTAHGPDGWVNVMTGRQVTVNVLQLPEHATELGFADLPAGKISQIRLHVNGAAQAPYVITNAGERHDLKVPSGEQSGIKLKGLWSVGPCEVVDVNLELDGKKSIWIHPTGHGELYVLRPVIRAGGSATGIDNCDPNNPPGGNNPGDPNDPYNPGDPGGNDPGGNDPGGNDPGGNNPGDPTDPNNPGDPIDPGGNDPTDPTDPNNPADPNNPGGDPNGGGGGVGSPCTAQDDCGVGYFCDEAGFCSSL